jgi:fluoride exporter
MEGFCMSWQAFFYVGIGGFLGANARYALSLLLNERLMRLTNIPLPYGTLIINVTGSMLLAMLSVWTAQRTGFLSDSAKLVIGTGFFGAYTTFSTYSNESINLIQGNQALLGWVYIIGTNALCLLAVLLGLWLGHQLWTA